MLPLFGGREVTCGFSGAYSGHEAVVSGTALVGKPSLLFETRLSSFPRLPAGPVGGKKKSPTGGGAQKSHCLRPELP